jgi:hypothetical protein
MLPNLDSISTADAYTFMLEFAFKLLFGPILAGSPNKEVGISNDLEAGSAVQVRRGCGLKKKYKY